MNQQAYAQRFQEAAAAAQEGDLQRAMTLSQSMLADNPDDPNALQVLGFCQARQGQSGAALTSFARANEIAPNQPPILNSLAALKKQNGDYAGALTDYEKVVELAPAFTEAHYNLAAILVAVGDLERAAKEYQTAIETNPNHPEALAKYAAFLETQHDLEKARTYAEKALAVLPANAVAHITLAELDARNNDHASVEARLTPYLQHEKPSPENAAILWNRLGRSLDKLERSDDAFIAFQNANEIQKVYYADLVSREQSPRAPENLTRLHRFFQTTDVNAWSTPEALSGKDPIFLVGFPRSGTTMLDQILTTHPSITVLEEKENLIDAWTDYILDETGIDQLPGLSANTIDHYRDAYWRRVDSQVDNDQLIIDKLPLDIALLGFIHRFFPRAKFIFAIRDPRDSVLSCYQQSFLMNAAMYQFLSIETAAQYYDQVMSLGKLCRERFPLRVHEVRYEKVVGNLQQEIEPLLAFLGVSWQDQMLKFYETAKERSIRTPSAKQVIEAPYKTSIEKWRRYEKYMAPALPTLNKWAAEFGYPVD